jgi:hypothetical protein
MTVDPIGPTQLNQSAWVTAHAKEPQFTRPFSAALFRTMFAIQPRQPVDGTQAKSRMKSHSFREKAIFRIGVGISPEEFAVFQLCAMVAQNLVLWVC